MSGSQLQAQAKALNARVEGEAQKVIDDIESKTIRKIQRDAFACVVKCYDKAGTRERLEVLNQCAGQCQQPAQRANQIMSEEINQFQSRLNRSMADCNDQARDMMTPGAQDDIAQMEKIQGKLMQCMTGKVDEHIKGLPNLKKRIEAQLKA